MVVVDEEEEVMATAGSVGSGDESVVVVAEASVVDVASGPSVG